MKINLPLVHKNLLSCMLCIGLVQMAAYYLAGTLASPDGSMAVPQPDTLLYCQAARRIAEGHPFSFAAGSAASTGTTSVLYPFILALPYLLGLNGAALLSAGFMLNALFYLIFLWGWAKAILTWFKEPHTQCLAALLIACSGQVAFCAAAQSDIGCWLAVNGLFVAGLATQNRKLYGAALLLGPWIRPEGMVCVVAFCVILALEGIWNKCLSPEHRLPPRPKTDGLLALAAIVSMAGVFALNIVLTGHAQFSSVANKGYFSTFTFTEAVGMSVGDFLKIAKCYFFGLVPAASARDLFVIPFLTAVFLWIGIFIHDWRSGSTRNMSILMLAACGGILTVAQSGWQDTNFDRYLVWTVPLFLTFIAEGAVSIGQFKRVALSWLPAAVCALFALGSAFAAVCAFHRNSATTNLFRQFACEINEKLPPTCRMGSFGTCGIAYFLGDRPYAHLSGIYSPEFSVKNLPSVLEILKNSPDTRFDYWFLTPDASSAIPAKDMDSCYGENILTGPDGLEVRRADWSAYDWAAVPHVNLPADLQLIYQVDVGDEASEMRADYETIDRYQRRPEPPFTLVADLAGKKAVEAARLLMGGDALTVPLLPGKDAHVVMRTYPKWTMRKSGNATDYTFANPLKLNLSVNDEIIQQTSLSYATNGLSDVTFTIPGNAIKSSPCRLAFLGDHIACGYWFYQ